MKKAQSGINAALLVAIIAAAIIIYILFLPTEERRALLEENETVSLGKTTGTSTEVKELLLEHPGRLEVIDSSKIEHDMPSFRLLDRSTAVSIEKVESISARNAWFDKKDYTLAFSVPDFENTDNVVLSFNVKKGKGLLTALLNGQEVYTNELNQGNVGPISLKKDYLKKEGNTLVFTVSGVGLAFWSTNEYVIENLKILGDTLDAESQKAAMTFLVSVTEAQNIDKAVLRFYPDCTQSKVGRLEISINRKEIYSAVPDCGLLKPLEFNPEYIAAGENTLEFKTLKGDMLIDSLLVRDTLKETPSITYYFELTQDQLDNVAENNADINATFTFVDDFSKKEADIIVNGKTTNIPRTEALQFVRNINIFVEEGSNSFKIVPQEPLDLKTLKVEYIEK